MAQLEIDAGAARRAMAEAGSRFEALLAPGVDFSLPVPGLSWTIGDLVAHVVAGMTTFAALATGEVTPEDLWTRYAPETSHLPANERMAVFNAAQVAELDRTLLPEAGRAVRAATQGFLDATTDWPPGVPLRSVEGDVDVAALTCVILGELLVHGRDLALGLGQRPTVPADEARLVLAGASALLPDYLDTEKAGEMRATIDLRVRGGPRVVLWVHDGVLEVSAEPTERIDCHVSADPVAFLLVSYGRQSHWQAALRGHLMAWGRRPWIAMQLPALLRNP